PEIMDAMLRSADIVRDQIDALGNSEEPAEGPADLIATLHGIANGSAEAAAPADGATPAEQPAAEDDATSDQGTLSRPLDLPPQKADLVEFMVSDLRDYLGELDGAIEQLDNDATREEAGHQLAEIGDNLTKTADFFELDGLTRVVKLFAAAAEQINDAPADILAELTVRLRAARHLAAQQADALEKLRVLDWSLDTFVERVTKLSSGEQIEPQFVGLHEGDIENVLGLDGVVRDEYPDPAAQAEAEAEPTAAASAEAPAEAAPAAPAKPEAKPDTKAADKPADKAAGKSVVEQTIRVEVGRLEALLNLVGQLVLNKNRVLGLTRELQTSEAEADVKEQFSGAASELDHLMGELQVSVMRTRMQPLAKLFDRYPRVIRDIARATEKKIDLVIEGKDTEVDKSVLEQLADPLVHILRNSADHGVEAPADRVAKGKTDTGTITLRAEHQGSHVRVAISDDGKGISREVIGGKAVERGLITAEQLAQMPDEDVYRFIFEAGLSTAKKVSDLSGRGVGMDVVKTNIAKVNGTINISSEVDKGTTMEILIPLTVAIMPAMVVRVGQNRYSIPLQSIVEIVRPEHVHEVGGQPVMRLRDKVLPLLDLSACLDEPQDESSGKFAVIVAVGGQSAGMLVDGLIGQQEIVIKPLDDSYAEDGPYSGATIQEDGGVSLILDVIKLIRNGTNNTRQAPPMRRAA
ncbi:MAG: chemotaxis protein CheA, partial [Myxococcota bacterium]